MMTRKAMMQPADALEQRPERLAESIGSERLQALQPNTVSYRSSGRVVLVGPATLVAPLAARFTAHQSVLVIVTDEGAGVEQETRGGPPWFRSHGAPVRVRGYLGQFSLAFESGGQTVSNDGLIGEGAYFDCVADAQREPAISHRVPPPGYFRLTSEQPYQALYEQIVDLKGIFDKPKYFAYQDDLCAHDRNGLSGCHQCLDHCPAGAIQSIAAGVDVNPYLCQGCGHCATTCPTGALSYQVPPLSYLLDTLAGVLRTYRQSTGERGLIVFSESPRPDFEHRTHSIWLQVESIASIGIEVWLSALAFGAGAVWMQTDDEQSVSETFDLLDREAKVANRMLDALGYGNRCIVLGPHKPDTAGSAALDATEAGRFAGFNDKRRVLRLAVEHLFKRAPQQPESVNLAAAAPFGEIRVDPDRCTLCMACVSNCPASALGEGGDHPALYLIEANCVQCGLCQDACPEDAVSLSPRYVFDPVKARTQRVLNEDAAFHCIACSKPFASAKMIETILTKVEGHPMFYGEKRDRLRMCEDCRVKQVFSSS